MTPTHAGFHEFPESSLNADLQHRPVGTGQRRDQKTRQCHFPNDQAIVGLGGALMLEQVDECGLQRRYMQLEGFKP